jgi:antibiotic biosynthesis monooxygenase (ABM) superfamily enzyme
MYGTVMIATLAVPIDQVEAAVAAWAADKGARTPGYVGQSVLLGDDGSTAVATIRFTDAQSYAALADDPEQDAWWASTMAPLFAGDVRWIDGHWRD